MFFLDALSSKEEEPILVLDDSRKIFEIKEDYNLFLEDSGSETNAEAGIYNAFLFFISLGYKLLSHTSCTISIYQEI